ncbi:hypothetical protein [Streptomyces sp. NPDC059883]|uniref:hypothetical protein n=1 Tax=unclassified Streptomyces TaxID=2593676 RepID=UPI0036680ECB
MATTSQKLLAYHRELTAGGLCPDLVNDLVKDAAQTIVMNDGLAVAPTVGTPPLSGESFTDQYANPSLVGTTPGP